MIYLLEDDDNIRELVVYSLCKMVGETIGFSTPSQMSEALLSRRPELFILDIMLPEKSGIDVLRELRKNPETKKVPVIMLTAKSGEFDKVRAFDDGADDYVTKPFGVMELAARVKAVMRRSTADQEADSSFCVGKLKISIPKRRVFYDDEIIKLTNKEFELLCYLIENRGIVADRDKILNAIWGYDFDGESRTVDVHVRTLRQKLGEGGQYIETVRGVGYRFAD